jgi:SAM-dependent methyltransferase
MKIPAKVAMISPDDGTQLTEEGEYLVSESGIRYPVLNGIPDLRPQKTIKGNIEYELQDHASFRNFPYQRSLLPMFPENLRIMNDLKESNVSGFIPPAHENAFCLDNGCGGGSMRSFLESYGYEYVGIDNESGVTTGQGGGERFEGGATHIGDLHRLPFPDHTFQFSVSYSVFEHLQQPIVAAKELFRVMQPGGICFAAIASIIPFHMDSFYHHTHFGVLNTFTSAGFEVKQIAPADWNAYIAISAMDGLPGPKWIRNMAANTIFGLHRFLWYFRTVSKRRDPQLEETRRRLLMPGMIKAILVKPGHSDS